MTYNQIKNTLSQYPLQQYRAFKVSGDIPLPEWITDKRSYIQKECLHSLNQQWDSYPKIIDGKAKLSYVPIDNDITKHRYDFVEEGDFIVRHASTNARCYAYVEEDFMRLFTARPRSIEEDTPNEYWADKISGLSLSKCLLMGFPFIGEDNKIAYCMYQGVLLSCYSDELYKMKNIGLLLSEYEYDDSDVILFSPDQITSEYRLLTDAEISSGSARQ